ncbi:hypothetical protein [Mammaliicoccus sciuri]|uniref:hypothetical protein n=1 Tax=Mammaliicoccus sciuri TaxID=1296 RepID=UPI0015FCD185|nr:hypothetical protein [Mammaliicoccus sciuri]
MVTDQEITSGYRGGSSKDFMDIIKALEITEEEIKNVFTEIIEYIVCKYVICMYALTQKHVPPLRGRLVKKVKGF